MPITPETGSLFHADQQIEKAATGAGESAAMGNFSPQALRSAAVTGRRAGYATGSGPFDDLASVGSAVISPLPYSGTAGRLTALSLLSGAGGVGGFVAGGLPGAAIGTTAASVGMPAVASRVLMSRPMQAYLKNQVLPKAIPMTRAEFLNAIASRGIAIAAARMNNS